MNRIDRYIRRTPKIYGPGLNPIVTALLKAWASSDNTAVQALRDTNAQIFVRTAEGQFLNRLASGLAVPRPIELPMLDETFQNLIPNLSLKAKQIRKTFYEICDVFWGPLFTRVNLTTNNVAPYNVSTGDEITVIIDGGDSQTLNARAGDIAIAGSATAEEIAVILNRLEGITVSVIEDQVTSQKSVNIRTNTLGPRGSIEISSTSSMISPTKLDFTTDERIRITNLTQRAVIYELINRELLIELPAVVPILLTSLKGSHHFHQDETIEAPVAPNNGIWQGSFLFAPTAVNAFTVTSQTTTISEPLAKGGVFTKVTVANAADIPNAPGFLIFEFGQQKEEVPVKYIGRPNNNTILLDPAHKFTQTHLTGATIHRVLPDLTALVPRITGEDLAIYLTSPSRARQVVQEFLESLAAAGVVVNFEILLPEYKYICFNPYE